MALIRSLSLDLARRRLAIQERAALTRIECDLDMVERAQPANRSAALALIAPPTKEEREHPTVSPPPGPMIVQPERAIPGMIIPDPAPVNQ